MSIRVRFAPSPTGRVHIGNMRVAIFNWLFARHGQGKFLLRIEDTDRERSTPQAIQTLLSALQWLKMDWDEPPVYQSQRREAHQAAADRLLADGAAYRDNKGGKGECVVFRMPGEDLVFQDEIKGALTKKKEDAADFVIVRSDGSPVFHLANVVDDIAMNITHILRGDDHIENTYRHVALFRALGASPPRYAHFPMVVNQNGKPYSKRDGDAFVGDFRAKGLLPDALFNYLTLLGWSPGEDREKMSRHEIVSRFTLDRVKNSPAQMDMRKLTHLNGQYMAETPPDEFRLQVRRCLEDCDWAPAAESPEFLRVCEMMQSRTKMYSQAREWAYFFSDAFPYEEKAVRKGLQKEGVQAALVRLRARLESIDFQEAAIETEIRAVEREEGIREGKLNYAIRVAVTGRATGAGLYETMALLGRDRCLARLRHATEHLCDESQ